MYGLDGLELRRKPVGKVGHGRTGRPSDAFLLWQPTVRTGLSKCSSLTLVNCGANELTRLDLSGCEKLGRLYCYDNRLETLDLSDLRRYSVSYIVMEIG